MTHRIRRTPWLATLALLAGCGHPAETPSGVATCPTVAASPSASATATAAVSATATVAVSATATVAPAPPPIQLAFVGDVALNYGIAKDIEAISAGKAPAGVDDGFPFGGVRDRLKKADLAVANLECVASTKGDVDTWHKPFRAPLAGIDIVLASGIDVVTVANNHSFDFGEAGFFDMLKNLDAKKLPVIGRGYRQKAPHVPETPLVVQVRETQVGLLGLYLATDDEIARDVKAAKAKAGVVVVYFHWGKEKQSDATPEQRRQARAAIDAGADLIVGSHVHVLQPTEMYKGRLIAYGLGNFVFMGMNTEERFRRGAILEVTLGASGDVVSYEMVPTRIDDRGAPRIVVPESSYLPGDKAGKGKDGDAK
ncbi:MAG: CapA family protein [Polyangiaceae bacterium]